MSLKIRKLFEPHRTIAYAIEDPMTGRFYDFRTGTFDDNPQDSFRDLKEDWKAGAGASLQFLRGAYANVDPTNPATVLLDTPREAFRAGPYIVYYVDRGDVDRTIEIEGWIAEEIDGAIEFRPQDARPAQPAATPGQTVNVNLPPNFTLGGNLSLSVALDQPVLPDNPVQPAAAAAQPNAMPAPVQAPQPQAGAASAQFVPSPMPVQAQPKAQPSRGQAPRRR